jgi:hypothetical protein
MNTYHKHTKTSSALADCGGAVVGLSSAESMAGWEGGPAAVATTITSLAKHIYEVRIEH